VIWSVVSGAIFYAGISIFARGIVPALFQRLIVSPNELARETPYLRSHINATRQAWTRARRLARSVGRGAADAGRHQGQWRHRGQCQTLGARSADADVQATPGNTDLL